MPLWALPDGASPVDPAMAVPPLLTLLVWAVHRPGGAVMEVMLVVGYFVIGFVLGVFTAYLLIRDSSDTGNADDVLLAGAVVLTGTLTWPAALLVFGVGAFVAWLARLGEPR